MSQVQNPIPAAPQPSAVRWPKNFTKYLSSLSDRIVGYFFPLFLVGLEWFFRSAFQINTSEFIGPALASIGVGLLIPLTAYRRADVKKNILNDIHGLPSEAIERIEELIANKRIRVETDKNRVFSNFCLLITFVFTLIWVYSVVLSTKYPNDMFWVFPTHYYPGFLCFFVGIILSELKETIMQ